MNNLPVIINGAGPVGLTMACNLARHGVAFRILDKAPEASEQSRALAIFPRTLEVFSTMGVLDQVLSEGQRLNRLSIYNDSKRLAGLEFNRIDSPWPFAISLPQSRTERILRARLETLGGKVEQKMELVGLDRHPDGVTGRYRRGDGTEETIAGSWLLGCDGAHSAARHLIGMNFQGAQYEEEFLLADVKVDSDLAADEAHLFLSRQGLLAYFPFRGGRGRLIATQEPGTHHLDQEEPAMEEIQQMARERCRFPLGLSDAVWKSWFRISHRMVEHYGAGRVWLAGDAAHIHSPAGGQGMNTGIQDAFNLAWKLALIIQARATLKLLDSYEAERMPVARSVVNLTDRLTRMGTAQHAAAQHLRDLFLPLLSGIPFLKDAMIERMAELSIDYRGSAWVENHGLGPIHAGDRAPDAILYDRTAGVERRIFDLLKTPGYLLLVFEGQKAAPPLDGLLRDLPGHAYRVTRPGREPEPGTLEDRDCRAGKIYGAEDDGLVMLIRPDGYVAFRGKEIANLEKYLALLKTA
ncbi:MAG TPA: FAD-dependent monooxygenase [Chthoniobacteraceae bacterium]|jgi:2-polyprenyl-6-methoxyphenol hydroxylase-like FAD-dependent oxidoreductase|nr:FAD-dependent monooxygenase [Chthoniobacteraceae bacterium]